MLYRWECRSRNCRQHGRWLKDPGAAGFYGEKHEDRTSSSRSQYYDGHPTVIVDNKGRDYGRST